MGWFTEDAWTSKELAHKGILEMLGDSLVAHDVGPGGNLWTVTTCQGERYLSVHLVEEKEPGRFWVKDLEESMYPFYFDCPPGLLEKMPEPRGENAMLWRAERLKVWAAVEASLN